MKPDSPNVAPGTSTEANDPPWLRLAAILRPQGRKGEVLADLYTDYPERFDPEDAVEPPRVFLARPGFTGTASEARQVTVLGFFLPVGKNQGRIVLHFDGIDSITAAETLAGYEVLVPYTERLEPEEDASYISDLLDCSVFDGETLIGTVDDVHLPTTPDGNRRLEDAAPLLAVLSPTGEEILIPFVKAYLIDLRPEEKRILMRLPPGLVEINAR